MQAELFSNTPVHHNSHVRWIQWLRTWLDGSWTWGGWRWLPSLTPPHPLVKSSVHALRCWHCAGWLCPPCPGRCLHHTGGGVQGQRFVVWSSLPQSGLQQFRCDYEMLLKEFVDRGCRCRIEAVDVVCRCCYKRNFFLLAKLLYRRCVGGIFRFCDWSLYELLSHYILIQWYLSFVTFCSKFNNKR